MPPHILSVIGMHRSGTSLAARYLSESGIQMGNEMLGKHWSNPEGHFEDKEFFDFHNALLKAHRVDYAVTSHMDWNLDESIIARAKSMVETRNKLSQWGWKDPRTTLFLPFWKKLIPDCHFVILYRHYLPVIRSLVSRDILLYRSKSSRLQRIMNPQFTEKAVQQLYNKYLRSWMWYNKEIITHILQDPNVKYHLVTYDQLIEGNYTKLNELKNHGFNISPPENFNRHPKRALSIKKLPPIKDETLLAEADAIDRLMLTYK